MLSYNQAGYVRLVLLLTLIFPIPTVAQVATTIATAFPIATQRVAPLCAQTCIQGAQRAQSECSETDQACLCRHSSTIQQDISSCLTTSKACSKADQQVAVAFYPQFCASYGSPSGGSAATTGPDGLVTAAGQAPTPVHGAGAGANSLVLTNTAGGYLGRETVTTNTSDKTDEKSGTGLAVPAILGITLGVFFIVCLILAVVVYTHVRRRQLKGRTRLEFLTTEFGDHLAGLDPQMAQRPPRSRSINSGFKVQPSPPAKSTEDFDFGLDISRTSTLVSVAPPLPAKLNTNKDLPGIRDSAYDVEVKGYNPSEINKGLPISADTSNGRDTFKSFVENSSKKMRESILGSRSGSRLAASDHDKVMSSQTQFSEKDEQDRE